MNRTFIEWVKNPDGTQGFTCNSKTGCLNHVDGKCNGGGFPCYAYGLANGRVKQRYLDNPNIVIPSHLVNEDIHSEDVEEQQNDPFYPRWWPEKLEQIRKRKKHAGIFLDDMSDWMGDYWPEEWTAEEIRTMINCPQHRFYTLTKQPQNLAKYSPFPDNCWVGVTATNSNSFHKNIVPFLDKNNYIRKVEAPIRFVSFEPLLGSVKYDEFDAILSKDMVDWVIIGAQTKPYRPPKVEWVKEIVEACDAAGIPVFLKDNLKELLPKEKPFYLPVSAPVEGRDPCLDCDVKESCHSDDRWQWFRQELPEKHPVKTRGVYEANYE